MIKVLVADDHRIMREGLSELLSEIPMLTVVGTSSDGAETLSKLSSLEPDLLILDISMQVLDGMEVLAYIKSKELKVKVVVLSMHKDARTIKRAIDGGADGYVLKEEAFDMLATCIDTVMQGKLFLSQGAKASLKTIEDEADAELTPREREVVSLIASGKTSKEIAQSLGISLKTVDNHRQRIMEKLDVHKATEIVRYAIQKEIVK